MFQDLLYQTCASPARSRPSSRKYPTGLQLGTGVAPVATARIFTQGNLQQVGGSLNLAIEGRGFFQILLPNGNTAYTRDGGFQLDSQGQIVTALGFALQPAITIPADALTITIGGDGTVSVTQPTSSTPTQVGNIQLADFINPGGLQAIGNNLYLETASSGPATTGDPGTNGLGVARPGLPGGLQCQRDRRAGRPDHGAARLRDQLARGAGLRRDAAAAGEPGMKA